MTCKLFSREHPIRGTIQPPGDKSISHRAIMIGAIANGTTYITNFLDADDCLETINVFIDLGVKIKQNGTDVQIDGSGLNTLQSPKNPLYVGNSGTTARLLLGLLAGMPLSAKVTGDDSLSNRPMARILGPLRKMGAKVYGDNFNETLPVTMKGTSLTGIHYTLPVKSAQVKSALLLAGLSASGRTTLIEPTQTRDHTEIMLKTFGADIHQEKGSMIISNAFSLQAQSIHVPGDISSAAFLLAAAAIVPHSKITVQEVGLNPTRTGFVECLKKMGANIVFHNVHEMNGESVGDITLTHQSLTSIVIEGEMIPRLIDEIPIIALIATQAHGTTIIRHAEELRVKETDRIEAIADILRTLGASFTKTWDGFYIHGKSALTGGTVKACGDHRIAMMAVIASTIAKEPVIIDDTSSIAISYPEFFSDLADLSNNAIKPTLVD